MIFSQDEANKIGTNCEVTELDISIVNTCFRSGESRGVMVLAEFCGEVPLSDIKIFDSRESLLKHCPTIESLLHLFEENDAWCGSDSSDEERMLVMKSFEDDAGIYETVSEGVQPAPYIFYGFGDDTIDVKGQSLPKVQTVVFAKNPSFNKHLEETVLDLFIDWKKNKDDEITGLIVCANFSGDVDISENVYFDSEEDLLKVCPTVTDLLSLFHQNPAWCYSPYRMRDCALIMDSLTGSDDLYNLDRKVKPCIVYGDNFWNHGEACIIN